MKVVRQVEKARGCGYRRPSAGGVGIYLVGPSTTMACGRLPFRLHVCSTCGGGIKPSRGWTWINPRALFEVDARALSKCSIPRALCSACWLGDAAPVRAGLLWIGEKFYPSPHDFMREATLFGVSRKIPAIPHGFVLGKTIVYFAHRNAVVTHDDDIAAGIFAAFRPTGIDLVIDDITHVPAKVQNMIGVLGTDKNVRVVQVDRDVDQQGDLFARDDEGENDAENDA